MKEDEFKNAIKIVKDNSIKLEQFRDTFLQGTVYVNNAGVLLTTIPYQKGWSVRVDGKEVITYAIDNGFLAFDVDEGKHSIQMNYMTPFFLIGAGITLISILAILIGIIFFKKHFR